VDARGNSEPGQETGFKKGTSRTWQILQALNPPKRISPPCRENPTSVAFVPFVGTTFNLQLMRLFWVQTPDIHPTKALFAKDKMPDRSLLRPVEITALSPKTSRPSAKTTKPISVSTSPVIVYKAVL
jgi:hypothetical protein